MQYELIRGESIFRIGGCNFLLALAAGKVFTA
jgi:hypothetical protein